jgi:hypothetical protein
VATVLIAIDPGPEVSGVVMYRTGADPAVLFHGAALPWQEVRDLLDRAQVSMLNEGADICVVCERVSAGAVSGHHIIETAEVVGRVLQACDDRGLLVRIRYRREILRSLGIGTGATKDALVRQVVLELHPGGVGTKKKPGPLYGVSSHAWQALGLACAYALEQGLYIKKDVQ